MDVLRDITAEVERHVKGKTHEASIFSVIIKTWLYYIITVIL